MRPSVCRPLLQDIRKDLEPYNDVIYNMVVMNAQLNRKSSLWFVSMVLVP
jgi:hypothetical protein